MNQNPTLYGIVKQDGTPILSPGTRWARSAEQAKVRRQVAFVTEDAARVCVRHIERSTGRPHRIVPMTYTAWLASGVR